MSSIATRDRCLSSIRSRQHPSCSYSSICKPPGAIQSVCIALLGQGHDWWPPPIMASSSLVALSILSCLRTERPLVLCSSDPHQLRTDGNGQRRRSSDRLALVVLFPSTICVSALTLVARISRKRTEQLSERVFACLNATVQSERQAARVAVWNVVF